MKKFKCRLLHIHCTAIISVIELIKINVKKPAADEALLIAALDEVLIKLRTQQVVYKKEYKLSFNPIQALSIRVLWEDYILPQAKDKGNQFINRMNQLNTEIIKTYEL